jgi:hypothetical protein
MSEKIKINGRWLSKMDKTAKEWAKNNSVESFKKLVSELESIDEDVAELKKLVSDLEEMAYAIKITEDAVETEYLGIEAVLHPEEIESEA